MPYPYPWPDYGAYYDCCTGRMAIDFDYEATLTTDQPDARFAGSAWGLEDEGSGTFRDDWYRFDVTPGARNAVRGTVFAKSLSWTTPCRFSDYEQKFTAATNGAFFSSEDHQVVMTLIKDKRCKVKEIQISIIGLNSDLVGPIRNIATDRRYPVAPPGQNAAGVVVGPPVPDRE